MTRRSAVNLRRLCWVGPATVAGSVLGVAIVQRIAISVVGPPPPALRFPMLSVEPLVITAVLVIAAVIVFAVIGDNAADPIRTFHLVAIGVLLASFVPNLVVAMSVGREAWRSAFALATMHVVAWAITVTTLTRLTALPCPVD